MDLSTEIRELQDTVAARQRDVVRAEHERDTAQGVVQRAEAKLSDLGVSTVEEAKALLVAMEDDLRASVAEVRAALSEGGTT